MKINCDVIMDLIPLVNDGVASEESKKLVNEHCQECEKCRALLDVKPEAKLPDDKILRSIKRNLFFAQWILGVGGILLGAWFTASYNMFYNFYIMPIVGIVSYLTLKNKSFYALIAIFVMTLVISCIKDILYINGNTGFSFSSLVGYFWFGVIYVVLAIIGIAIASLFCFAFRRKGVNTNSKKTTKISALFTAIAIIVAVAFIGIILFIGNSFVGNPISSFLAKGVAQKYIAKTYPDLDLTITESGYNFKFSNYYFKVNSKNSIDTHFTVDVSGNNVQDDYEFRVLQGNNTYDRYCEEYKKETEVLIKNKIVGVSNIRVLTDGKLLTEEYVDGIDLPFDKSKFNDVDYLVSLSDKSFDTVYIASTIKTIYTTLKDNGYDCKKISLNVENGDKYIEISGVEPKHIEEADFESIIQKAIDNGEYDGIYVFGKSDNDK